MFWMCLSKEFIIAYARFFFEAISSISEFPSFFIFISFSGKIFFSEPLLFFRIISLPFISASNSGSSSIFKTKDFFPIKNTFFRFNRRMQSAFRPLRFFSLPCALLPRLQCLLTKLLRPLREGIFFRIFQTRFFRLHSAALLPCSCLFFRQALSCISRFCRRQ